MSSSDDDDTSRNWNLHMKLSPQAAAASNSHQQNDEEDDVSIVRSNRRRSASQANHQTKRRRIRAVESSSSDDSSSDDSSLAGGVMRKARRRGRSETNKTVGDQRMHASRNRDYNEFVLPDCDDSSSEDDDSVQVEPNGCNKFHATSVTNIDGSSEENVDLLEAADSVPKQYDEHPSLRRRRLPHQEQKELNDVNSDEDDLLNEAFFDSPKPQKRRRMRAVAHYDEEEDDKENDRDAWEQQYIVPNKNDGGNVLPQVEVVDLCGGSSDEDSDEQEHATAVNVDGGDDFPSTNYHEGLRVPSRSPRFNQVGRRCEDFYSSNELDGVASANVGSPMVRSAFAQQTTTDDDIIDCWSSDEEGTAFAASSRPRHQNARRVTDSFTPAMSNNDHHLHDRNAAQHQQSEEWAHVELGQSRTLYPSNQDGGSTTRNTAAPTNSNGTSWNQAHEPEGGDMPPHHSDDIAAAASTVAPVPNRWNNSDRRLRKLRDATNTSFARAVVLRDDGVGTSQQGNHHPPSRGNTSYNNAPFCQANNDVWYRAGRTSNTSGGPFNRGTATTQRNDLTGGSGAGAGGYYFQPNIGPQGNEVDDASNYPGGVTNAVARPTSWTATKNKSSSKRKSNNGRGTGRGAKKKKSWGGGRGRYNNYKRKGQGRGKSSNRKGGGRRSQSSRRNGGGDAPYMEISRQDPQLKHVGGANIIF